MCWQLEICINTQNNSPPVGAWWHQLFLCKKPRKKLKNPLAKEWLSRKKNIQSIPISRPKSLRDSEQNPRFCSSGINKIQFVLIPWPFLAGMNTSKHYFGVENRILLGCLKPGWHQWMWQGKTWDFIAGLLCCAGFESSVRSHKDKTKDVKHLNGIAQKKWKKIPWKWRKIEGIVWIEQGIWHTPKPQ